MNNLKNLKWNKCIDKLPEFDHDVMLKYTDNDGTEYFYDAQLIKNIFRKPKEWCVMAYCPQIDKFSDMIETLPLDDTFEWVYEEDVKLE